MKKIKREIYFKDIKDIVIIDRHQYNMMIGKIIDTDNKIIEVRKLIFKCKEHRINELIDLIEKLEEIVM